LENLIEPRAAAQEGILMENISEKHSQMGHNAKRRWMGFRASFLRVGLIGTLIFLAWGN
jgi:hypothetical protein